MCFGRLKNFGEYVILRGVCRFVRTSKFRDQALARSSVLRICKRKKAKKPRGRLRISICTWTAKSHHREINVRNHGPSGTECKCPYSHCHGPILNMRFLSMTGIGIFFCPSNSFRFRCSLRKLINHIFSDAICFVIKSIGTNSRTVIKCFTFCGTWFARSANNGRAHCPFRFNRYTALDSIC